MNYRKTNKLKRIDSGCRNNGTCKVCNRNRTHTSMRDTQDRMSQFLDEIAQAKVEVDDVLWFDE